MALLPMAPAHADEERAITAFEVDVDVDDDGTVRVTERLSYTFGDDDASVLRVLPHRSSIDGGATQDLELSDVEVTDAAGEEYEVDRLANETEIEIGEEGMTGTPTFEISYEYGSLLVADGSNDARLFLDIVGEGMEIPVHDVDVSVTLPDEPRSEDCYAGRVGSTNPCDDVSSDGETTTAAEGTVAPHQAMSIDVVFPKGDIELASSTRSDPAGRHTPSVPTQLPTTSSAEDDDDDDGSSSLFSDPGFVMLLVVAVFIVLIAVSVRNSDRDDEDSGGGSGYNPTWNSGRSFGGGRSSRGGGGSSRGGGGRSGGGRSSGGGGRGGAGRGGGGGRGR
ncbi:DUF2207 domain-containing protein [Spiractinospora alimapuensis]|uniref:DUF2207 domain-containing protein n=1 Tax=Spiractinospora alimapuensis TaxID=2820884 RepID=UPI001F2A5ACD|nr:DUF2207 domain-containing protein [Spiractinospora alimapuensis]QVQ52731.1 DUF2207 domain-containing protein [Spiractinospora alimapuensis]